VGKICGFQHLSVINVSHNHVDDLLCIFQDFPTDPSFAA
jgi:hypothetical protein